MLSKIRRLYNNRYANHLRKFGDEVAAAMMKGKPYYGLVDKSRKLPTNEVYVDISSKVLTHLEDCVSPAVIRTVLKNTFHSETLDVGHACNLLSVIVARVAELSGYGDRIRAAGSLLLQTDSDAVRIIDNGTKVIMLDKKHFQRWYTRFHVQRSLFTEGTIACDISSRLTEILRRDDGETAPPVEVFTHLASCTAGSNSSRFASSSQVVRENYLNKLLK